jgi:hypothetical protein
VEKDILGQAVDETAKIFNEARKAIHDLVPLGPRNVRMTSRELRRQVERNPGLGQFMTESENPGAQRALQQLLSSDLTQGFGENLTPEE